MNVYEAITTRRTIRRFKQQAIDEAILERIVDSARLAPSAANCQPLEYILVSKPSLCKQVFDLTAWAGRVTPRRTPKQGQEPVAWVVTLVNSQRGPAASAHDAGAAIENMILTALAEGIGSCWIGSVKRDELAKILNVPELCTIDSVLALGYAEESPTVEETDEDIAYYLDDNDVLHVPKRKLKDVLHRQRYCS